MLKHFFNSPKTTYKVEFNHLLREKPLVNFIKKCAALDSYKNKILAERKENQEIRKQKLEQFRIDFMPLCTEEDMIIMASTNKSKTGENSAS
jgi:hypothetical protein